MLNEAVRITPVNDANCNVAWTAPTPDSASWVFINGGHARGPFVTGTVERLIRVPFGLNDMVALEVHDFPDDSVQPDPIATPPNTQPTLIWNAVDNAVRYRIYHRQFGTNAEELIYDKPARIGFDSYEVLCPVNLAGGPEGSGKNWHFLRVEAVDQYGNESTRQTWAFFVYDLPATPPALLIEPGSAPGLYNFTVQ